MSRKPHPTPQADLELSEEDAYAHLVLVANDNATDADRKKLIKAGILSPDPDQKAIEDKQTPVAPAPTKAPPAQLPSLARGNAIRYIIAYANGRKPSRIMRELGIDWGDIQRYRWSDPQFAVVQDFVERERHHLLALKASEAAEGLMDGTIDPKEVNAKIITFVLERLRRESFSDPKNAQGGGGPAKGGGVTYNITFNGSQSPNLCGLRVGNPAEPPVIDIKAE